MEEAREEGRVGGEEKEKEGGGECACACVLGVVSK